MKPVLLFYSFLGESVRLKFAPVAATWKVSIKARQMLLMSRIVGSSMGLRPDGAGDFTMPLTLRLQLRQNGLLGDGGAVGSGIGTGEVYTALGVAHDGFAVAHGSGESSHGGDDVAAAR